MPKNILTFVSNLGRASSGLESQIYEEFVRLSKDNKLFVISEKISSEIDSQIHAIETKSISTPKLRAIYKTLQYVLATRRIKDQFDVIYLRTFSLPEVAASLIAKKFYSKRLVLLVPGSWIFFGGDLSTRLLRFTYKRILEDADTIIVYSKRMMPELEGIFALSLKRSKIVEIRNAVDSGEHTERIDNNKIILSVGRIHPLKRFEDIISAIPHIKEKIPDIQLQIIGTVESESYLNKLKDLIDSLKCRENVSFIGSVPHNQLMTYYRKACVFAIMGKNEGIPRSLLEAMSCALPTVAAPNSGIPDVIQDGKNGFLVENNDSKKLAKTILKIMDDVNIQKDIGKSAYDTIRNDHNWEKFVNKLQLVFDQNNS